jgi:hypothetical protein
MTTRKTTGDTETSTSITPSTIVLHTTTPSSLVGKLAAIIGAIGPRRPQGTNKFHKYDYFSDEQISEIFQKPLAEAGIIIVPQVRSYEITPNSTQKGDQTFLTTILVDYLITDGVESLTATGIGQGDDPGDKGANKAMTGAMKFMLLKLAQIGAASDAEADERTDSRRAATAPVVGPSNIEGVERGGRQPRGTQAQIQRIRMLARDLHIDAHGVGRVVKNVIGDDVELPEEGEAGPMMVAYLGTLKADQLGAIVSALEEAKSRGGEGATDPTTSPTGDTTPGSSTPTEESPPSTSGTEGGAYFGASDVDESPNE